MPLALFEDRPWLGVTRTLTVTCLRPTPVGTTVLIECEAVQRGKALCLLRGVMRRKSDGVITNVAEHTKFNTDLPPSKM